MTLTIQQDDTGDRDTPRLEFYVTARYTEYPDPRATPRGVALPPSVYVTKMAPFRAAPDELAGVFADRVCAILVARRRMGADSDGARDYAMKFFRQQMSMKLICNGRLCDDARPMKDYFTPKTPFLELEVRSV